MMRMMSSPIPSDLLLNLLTGKRVPHHFPDFQLAGFRIVPVGVVDVLLFHTMLRTV